MKFTNILLCAVMMATAIAQQTLIDMDAVTHHAGRVVHAVHENLKNMPLKKSTIKKNLFRAKHIPHSLARDYDEALLRQYHRERALGQAGQVSGGSWRCKGDDFFGLYLGFVWGLQYDKNAPGVCYSNLRSTIRALNLLIQNLYLIFLPDQWAKLAMSGQDILTLGSALYANCQIQ